MGRVLTGIPTLLILISLACTVSIGAGADQCTDCHVGNDPDGDYHFNDLDMYINGPTRVSLNDSLSMSLIVTHHGEYSIGDLKATLGTSDSSRLSLEPSSKASRSLSFGTGAETKTITWELRARDLTCDARVTIDVEYTAHHKHNTVDDDDWEYSRTLEHDVQVKDLPIELSTWAIQGMIGRSDNATIQLSASEAVYNVQVLPNRAAQDFIDISPTDIGDLDTGDKRDIRISIAPKDLLTTAEVLIIWSSDANCTEKDMVSVPVMIQEQSIIVDDDAPSKGARLAGRILGFVGLLLLVLLLPTGGLSRSIARKMDSRMTAPKRVSFHCAISYQLMSVTLVHAALLMYGHYRSLMWNGVFLISNGDVPGINLGGAALLLMGSIGLSGILQKRISRSMGAKNWRRMHGYMTWTALILVSIHLILVGTTLGLPVREALNI